MMFTGPQHGITGFFAAAGGRLFVGAGQWQPRFGSQPAPFGAFHLTAAALMLAAAVLMIVFRKKLPKDDRTSRRILLALGAVYLALEIYKQIVCSYEPSTGAWSYDWSKFPFQFCSLPIFLCPLAALLPDRASRAVRAFLASFGLFGGFAVMSYPSPDVFSEIAFLDFHSMIWHSMMVLCGAWLWLSGNVRPSWRHAIGALAVYFPTAPAAAVLNEIGHSRGIPLDLFHISPYFRTGIPVLSAVQRTGAPYPVMFLSYQLVFGAIGMLLFLAAFIIEKIYLKLSSRACPAERGT